MIALELQFILTENDHLIEYNIIHDAVTDGHDMGAIYYGRNPSEQGNIVRYNYFPSQRE
jgi:hypothetical protein